MLACLICCFLLMCKMADWNDENTRILCELCAEQVKANNRSGTHLNKIGYDNVMAKFTERTSISYDKLQIKNKWDKLRQDYTNWKVLLKETGLGWDNERKTVRASDAWWKKKTKEVKGITKFKDRGLQNEDLLAEMFEDIRNSGDDHWCPLSDVVPQSPAHEIHVFNQDEEDGGDKDDESAAEEVTPSCGQGKRRRVPEKDKGKKSKTTRGQWMEEQFYYIVSLNEKTSASCESMARREDTSGCAIKDVMALVKECGAKAGSKEHFIATQVFTKKAEREMFMTLDTLEERFEWLKMKYEWTTRNDIFK
ncbi:L10-interacting MYB domain-containing protein-like isoform X2 [Phragmites australis]|uniref:L10-interacting MYB domain-containing protein-like isoform X2 n=1 Tax=Phragmites australis TaxID=29695 RepID=UPI002D768330|nr:L10-interacting MYB domain-containing protein-like isoform X2 [Phragmites australis]